MDEMVTIATERFDALIGEAHTALNAIERFWTLVYGPNEAVRPARECLDGLDDAWHGGDEPNPPESVRIADVDPLERDTVLAGLVDAAVEVGGYLHVEVRRAVSRP